MVVRLWWKPRFVVELLSVYSKGKNYSHTISNRTKEMGMRKTEMKLILQQYLFGIKKRCSNDQFIFIWFIINCWAMGISAHILFLRYSRFVKCIISRAY